MSRTTRGKLEWKCLQCGQWYWPTSRRRSVYCSDRCSINGCFGSPNPWWKRPGRRLGERPKERRVALRGAAKAYFDWSPNPRRARE